MGGVFSGATKAVSIYDGFKSKVAYGIAVLLWFIAGALGVFSGYEFVSERKDDHGNPSFKHHATLAVFLGLCGLFAYFMSYVLRTESQIYNDLSEVRTAGDYFRVDSNRRQLASRFLFFGGLIAIAIGVIMYVVANKSNPTTEEVQNKKSDSLKLIFIGLLLLGISGIIKLVAKTEAKYADQSMGQGIPLAEPVDVGIPQKYTPQLGGRSFRRYRY